VAAVFPRPDVGCGAAVLVQGIVEVARRGGEDQEAAQNRGQVEVKSTKRAIHAPK
jgi:hypothetical protein